MSTRIDSTAAGGGPRQRLPAGRSRRVRSTWSRRTVLGIVLAMAAAYFLYAGWFLRGAWHRVNPDGVSCLDIARLYANGRWDDALNAYWSPLYCVLLAGAERVVGDGLLAARAIAVAAGAAWIGLTFGLVRCITRDRRWALVGACGVLLNPHLPVAWRLVDPDLLVACLATGMWWLVASSRRRWGLRHAAAFGALGAAGYLLKQFLLPFTLVAAAALALRRIRRGGRWRPAAASLTLALAAGPAAAACLLWGAALASRYGTWTCGSAAEFSYRTFVLGEDTGFYAKDRRPMPIPPAGRSMWDDPVPPGSPLLEHSPPFDPAAIAARAWENGGRTLTTLASMLTPAGLAAMVFPLILLCRGRLGARAGWPTALAALWVLGYTAVIVESRFLWAALPVGWALICHGLSGRRLRHCLIRPSRRQLRIVQTVFLAGLAASLAYMLAARHVEEAARNREDAAALALGRLVRPHLAGGDGVLFADEWTFGLEAAYHGGPGVRFAGVVPHAAASAWLEEVRGYAPRYAGETRMPVFACVVSSEADGPATRPAGPWRFLGAVGEGRWRRSVYMLAHSR